MASLKSMAADATVPGVKKTDLYRVDPRLLVEEEEFNLRDYSDPEVIEHIAGFAHSYSIGAYVPPLVVRTDDTGRVVVVEGHCRRFGALKAISEGVELAYVDCISFRGNDAERVEVMLRSAEGLKLKPLKVAMGYLRLNRLGHSNSELARRVGKTPAHVEQMLLLAFANSDVHELVRSGKVAAYAAIDAVREHGEAAGKFLAGKAEQSGNKTVTRSAIQEWAPSRKHASSMFCSLQSLVTRMEPSTRRQLAEFESMDPEDLKDKKIEIDAATLLELFKAHSAAQQAKQSKEETAAKAREAAKQQAIDLAENSAE